MLPWGLLRIYGGCPCEGHALYQSIPREKIIIWSDCLRFWIIDLWLFELWCLILFLGFMDQPGNISSSDPSSSLACKIGNPRGGAFYFFNPFREYDISLGEFIFEERLIAILQNNLAIWFAITGNAIGSPGLWKSEISEGLGKGVWKREPTKENTVKGPKRGLLSWSH